MQHFSNSVKQGRRGFIALTTAALASITVNAQRTVPPQQTELNPLLDDVSPADSLMLYLDLLDGVRESILEVELRELSDLKNLVSERFRRIIGQAEQVSASNSDPEAQAGLLQTIKDSKAVHRRFDDERNERLDAIRALGSNIDSIKQSIVTAATILRGFKTFDSTGESAHSADTDQVVKAASASLNSAIGKLRELTSQSRVAVASYKADTIIMILEAVDSSIRKPKSDPAKKSGIDHAHFSPQMTITQAKQRAKQIIRDKFPPGLFLQVWIGFAGVWHILEGVADESTRRRLLIDCLKVIPSWRANRDTAASELAKLKYQ